MHYVYILQAVEEPEHFYVGVTSDLRDRLKRHNSVEISHTSKFARRRIKTYLAFSDEAHAFAFERYLKTASGHPLTLLRPSAGAFSRITSAVSHNTWNNPDFVA